MTGTIYKILWVGLLASVLLLVAPSVSSYPLPTEIFTAITFFTQQMKNWNWLFNFDALFQCVVIIVVYEVIVWSWFKIIMPVVKALGSAHSE